MTTAIANPGSAIGTIDVVRSLSSSEGAFTMIGRAFPGELTEQQQRDKGISLLEGAAIYLANVKKESRAAILQCARQSLVEALVNLASVDLTLTKSLGHAYLIPYGGVCTLMIGYKGLAELVMRTDRIASIQTAVVYQGEEDCFSYELGTNGYISHKPRHDIPRDWEHTAAAWMEAVHTGGGRTIEVMDKLELAKVRKASAAPNSPAWQYWPSQMTRKAPLRRGASYLPKGGGSAAVALARALTLENAEYDLDKYHAMRKVESRKLTEEAAASLGGTDTGATPSTNKTPPPPVDLMAGKRALLNRVSEARTSCNSTLTDIEFCEQVIFDQLGKNKIGTQEELDKVSAAIKSGAYDWETGDKIPQEQGAS